MSTADDSGKAKLYKFDVENNIFDNDSTIDIDTAIVKSKSVTLDNYIYTIMCKNLMKKIIVKKSNINQKKSK